jgi:hypothetical protein
MNELWTEPAAKPSIVPQGRGSDNRPEGMQEKNPKFSANLSAPLERGL